MYHVAARFGGRRAGLGGNGGATQDRIILFFYFQYSMLFLLPHYSVRRCDLRQYGDDSRRRSRDSGHYPRTTCAVRQRG